jgi:hypothetical protein
MTNPLNKILDEMRVCDDVREAQAILDETFYIYGADSEELERVGELYHTRINELIGSYGNEN